MSGDQVTMVSKIVEVLKKPPFNKRLSLVTFDQQTDQELLGLLNDVLVYLDEKQHSVDLAEETEERRGQRIAQFLNLMKYPAMTKDVENLMQGLASGKQAVVYPVLNWLLTDLDKLKKRAYLAYFLIPIEVPQEFFQAPEVKDTHAAYKALQKRFTAQHKKVETFRENKRAPAELTREIKQLEVERGQLKEKIAKLRSVTADIKGFSEMLTVTSEYRQEQEVEVKLHERIQEQQHLLRLEEQHFEEVKQQVAAMERKREHGANLSAAESLKRLELEVRACVRACVRALRACVLAGLACVLVVLRACLLGCVRACVRACGRGGRGWSGVTYDGTSMSGGVSWRVARRCSFVSCSYWCWIERVFFRAHFSACPCCVPCVRCAFCRGCGVPAEPHSLYQHNTFPLFVRSSLIAMTQCNNATMQQCTRSRS
jgi:hypothetical protein